MPTANFLSGQIDSELTKLNMANQQQKTNLIYFLASAGSGKTFQLVENYLAILEEKKITDRPEKIAAITALTFTNKAANEIKERIVKRLKEKNNDSLKSFKPLLMTILHNYDFLQIATIDSFLLRLVSPFTIELGLNPGFKIELNRKLVIKKSIDQFINSLQKDEEVLKLIAEIINEKLQSGKSWRIDKLLEEFVLSVSREDSMPFINQMNDNSLQSLKEKVEDQFFSVKKEISEQAQKIKELMTKYKTNSDQDYIANCLKLAEKFLNYPNEESFKNIDKYLDKENLSNKLIKVGCPEQEINLVKNNLAKIKELKERFLTLKLIRENFGPLQLNNHVTDYIKKYCQQRNIVFLEDLLDLALQEINSLSNVPLAEYFGSKIENFLIDEFQDTSRRQWELLAFFIQEALANGHNNYLFGDVKQAIYRWRNGDLRISLELPKNKPLSNFYKEKRLNYNYRSSQAIVEFNNKFFSTMVKLREENQLLKTVFENLQSFSYYDFPGMVNVEIITPSADTNLSEKDDDDVDEDEFNLQLAYLERIKWAINELKKDGFKLNEIALLLRTNQGCQEMGEQLAYEYPIASSEALLVKNSLAVSLLVKLLFWFFRNRKSETKKEINLLLNLIEQKLDHNQLTNPHPRWEEFLNIEHSFSRSLYFLAEELIDFFDLNRFDDHHIYLEAFLNSIIQFQEIEAEYPGDFLDWWKENESELTLQNFSTEALNILTCHKAKGLEFRAVIVALYKWENKRSSQNYFWLEPNDTFCQNLRLIPSRMVVKGKREVSESAFKESFKTEQLLAEIDDFNLLYVACTRPKERLYLFIERPCRRNQTFLEIVNKAFCELFKDKNGKIIFNCQQTKPAGLIHAPEENLFQTSFEWKKDDKVKSKIDTAFIKKNLSANLIQSKYQEEGRLIHQKLEKKLENIEKNHEFEKFPAELLKFLQFLQKNFPIELIERELYYQKRFLRPDRILLNKQNEFVLIDFKTGKEDKTHYEQMALYRQALQNAGYIHQKSYLIYLSPFKIKELDE